MNKRNTRSAHVAFKLTMALAIGATVTGCATAASPKFAKDTVATFHARIAEAKKQCGPGESTKTNTNCYLLEVKPWWENPEPGRAEAMAFTLPTQVPPVADVTGLTAEAAFQRLCLASAGDFIVKSVSGVNGFVYLRPRREVTDYEITNLYALEDPAGYSVSDFPRIYENFRPFEPSSRATPNRHYSVVETVDLAPADHTSARYVDPSLTQPPPQGVAVAQFTKIPGSNRTWPYHRTFLRQPSQAYGITWRGVESNSLRELGIAAGETLIVDLADKSVLGVRRNFYLIRPAAVPEKTGLHWAAAFRCPNVKAPVTGWKIRDLVTSTLIPKESNE